MSRCSIPDLLLDLQAAASIGRPLTAEEVEDIADILARESLDAMRYRWLKQWDIAIDAQMYGEYTWYAYAGPNPHGRPSLDDLIDEEMGVPR